MCQLKLYLMHKTQKVGSLGSQKFLQLGYGSDMGHLYGIFILRPRKWLGKDGPGQKSDS